MRSGRLAVSRTPVDNNGSPTLVIVGSARENCREITDLFAPIGQAIRCHHRVMTPGLPYFNIVIRVKSCRGSAFVDSAGAMPRLTSNGANVIGARKCDSCGARAVGRGGSTMSNHRPRKLERNKRLRSNVHRPYIPHRADRHPRSMIVHRDREEGAGRWNAAGHRCRSRWHCSPLLPQELRHRDWVEGRLLRTPQLSSR